VLIGVAYVPKPAPMLRDERFIQSLLLHRPK
jgi:hypothetical protein